MSQRLTVNPEFLYICFSEEYSEVVLTREIRDEHKNVVSQSIHSILNDEQVKRIIEKVVDGVTIEEKIDKLEQKIEAIAIENSTEAAILKSENEYLLRVFDDIDQQTRNMNLRIFNLTEKSGEDLPQEIIKLCNSKLDVPIEKTT
nr:unnamed protein product [Callosobruchus chinensis]